MFAEFIDRPITGQFPEKHFGDVSPYSSWVKFTDKIFQEWVGSFAQNWDGYLTSIINFEKQEIAFVIACGNGYLVDIAKRQLLSDKVIEAITSAIKDYKRQSVIFTNGYNLQIMDKTGKASILLDKYFFDEIEFLEIRDDILFARYWYYQKSGQPFSFQMNLLNFEIIDTFNDLAHKIS
jgi:hypothetical protein